MIQSSSDAAPLTDPTGSIHGIETYVALATRSAADQDTQSVNVQTEPTVVSAYFRWKNRIDWCMTLALSVVAIPLIAITALMILLLDGRPVFYRQIRIGLRGQQFKIWKFRTMRPNAEQTTGAVWSNRSDPRVTRLGRWMRCCHLDELPQFFNILRGDMNLIGPRPERPEFVLELTRKLPSYSQRTAVRPGITGLAQLRLGYDEQLAEVGKKVALDLRYIRTANIRLDASLLVWTIPYIVYQILSRMALSLRRRSQKDDTSVNIVPLVSPTHRVDEPQEPPLGSPHFSDKGQHSSSNRGESKRCSA